MQVAWFQLLLSATEIRVKLLPPTDFQLFVAHCVCLPTSVGALRATGPVLELFREARRCR